MIKLILDGALFSESEMLSTNRNGMIRIAEEVLHTMIRYEELDIAFANTIYSKNYDSGLRSYLNREYPAYRGKIVSSTPVFSSSISGLNRMTRELSKLLSMQVKGTAELQGDIFHSFYYPFNKNISSNPRIKKSITLLDIIPLRFPGYDKSLIEMTKQVVESIVSNYAVSISEFSRQDLLDYDKRINPERVFVAPLAASEKLFFQNTDREDWTRVRQKYGLPEKYFLSVSSTDIRKNLPHVITCFNRFVLQEKPKDLYLVLTGNSLYSHSILDTLNIERSVREKIIITKTYIENNDLSVVYSNALSFFFMSLYEGFGLPVLEAMQCGVPVVTSNVSSMPEVAGNAAILINPKDENALSSTMTAICNDGSLRTKYSSLGLTRAKEFSWERCAQEYVEIFKKIASNG